MNYIKENIKTLGIVGCAIMLIGNFLPFIKADASLLGYSVGSSISLLSKEQDIYIVGIVAIILEAIMLFLICKNKKKLTLIPNALILIFLIACKQQFSGVNFGIGSVKYGIGFYAILIGSIICIVYAFIQGSTKLTNPIKTFDLDKIKSGFNDLENGNSKTKFCAYCGSKLDIEAKFCDNCGKKC